MAAGAFEALPGSGQPLRSDENVFEAIAGDGLAHRILKNAGCAPAWVEQGKAIRGAAARAREQLAACLVEILVTRGNGSDTWRPGSWQPQPQLSPRATRELAAHAPHAWSAAIAAAADELVRDVASRTCVPAASGEGGAASALAEAAAASAAASVAARDASAADADAAAADATAAAAAVTRLPWAEAAVGVAQLEWWGQRQEDFESQLAEINRQIATYNLVVPGAWQHLAPLRVDAEFERAARLAPTVAARHLDLIARSGRRAAPRGGAHVAAWSASGSAATWNGAWTASAPDVSLRADLSAVPGVLATLRSLLSSFISRPR